MVRAIVTPDDTHVQVDVPADYVGKRLEVNIFLADEINTNAPKKTMADFRGIISKERADELNRAVLKSKDEWERNI